MRGTARGPSSVSCVRCLAPRDIGILWRPGALRVTVGGMSAPDRVGPTLLPPDPATAPPARESGFWSAPEGDGDDDGKRRKKEAKLKEQLESPLDPFTRYKALTDAFKAEQDLVELADKKARFALVIMGALNAAVLLVVTRGPLDTTLRGGVFTISFAVLLALYAGLAIYFFLLAIETLRPRSGASVPAPGAVTPGTSANVRYNQAIVARPLGDYRAAWEQVRIDNLNVEIATQIHVIAGINVRKYAVLSKLYRGLNAMTVLVAVLLLDLAAAALLR